VIWRVLDARVKISLCEVDGGLSKVLLVVGSSSSSVAAVALGGGSVEDEAIMQGGGGRNDAGLDVCICIERGPEGGGGC
jgi:hypothetical protein